MNSPEDIQPMSNRQSVVSLNIVAFRSMCPMLMGVVGETWAHGVMVLLPGTHPALVLGPQHHIQILPRFGQLNQKGFGPAGSGMGRKAKTTV